MASVSADLDYRRFRDKGREQSTTSLVHTKEIVVRFSEVDALGIVWHGHYVTYMEDGRESFGAEFGLSYLDVKSHGYTIPLVHLSCSFKRSLKYGDVVIVETSYIPCQAAKIHYKYKIYSKDEKDLVAEGETVQVFLDSDQQLSLNNPIFYEDWKKRVGIK